MIAKRASETNQKTFEVRFGKGGAGQTGNREKRAGLSFLRQMDRLSKASRLSGNVARGRAAGRGSFVRTPLRGAQRVVVKARVVQRVRGAQNKSLLKAHVNYISRDGAGETEELSPKLYNEKGEMSGKEVEVFQDVTARDRHHFRFIISPENARNLDLTSYTKETVSQMEKDLGTKLEFVAANHYNTDNPHAHIIVRAKDSDGKDLVISKDYLANGIRNRACEIATRHLGMRSELEIRAGLTAETTKERFTQIDRDLLKTQAASPDQTIATRRNKSHERSFQAFKRAVQVQRLKVLKKMNLAFEISPGVWRLDSKLEVTLKELSERGAIIKTMHKTLKKDAFQERAIFDAKNANQLNVTGVVLDKGLRDELKDEKYMIVSATDGRAYYVPLSKYSEAPDFTSKPGSIVTLSVKKAEGQARKSDETIEEIAALNGGVYSREAHLKKASTKRLPKGVSVESYIGNHVTRLAALETRGFVKRVGIDAWEVPTDLKERVLEGSEGKNNFVQVKLESYQDLAAQAKAIAPTWIDTEFAAGRVQKANGLKTEFLQSLEEAKRLRLKTLCELGQAHKTGQGFEIRKGFKEELYKLQMDTASKAFACIHGVPHELSPGQSFIGTIRQIEHLPSGTHVVVGDGKKFVTVPFQKGMDRLKGQPVKLEMQNSPERSIRVSAVQIDRQKNAQIGFEIN